VRKLVATMGEAMNRASIVYVVDSFAGGVEPDDDGLSAIPHASSRTSPTTSTCSSSVHALGAVHSAACSSPSVSTHLLGRAHCPLLVVPAAAGARTAAAIPVPALQLIALGCSVAIGVALAG
jgi:hypothetical protein